MSAMSMTLGLTGAVASGKSTVSAMFKALGATVLDADIAARMVVAPGTPGLAEIARRFGARALQNDGSLDRKALGKIVFSDAAERAALEEIVHPLVFDWMKEQLAQASVDGAPLVVLDIPLLFETKKGLALCQKTLVVWAPEQTQLERLTRRDGLTQEEAWQRIRSQMPIQQKRALADFEIDNSGTLSSTEAQVRRIFSELTGR